MFYNVSASLVCLCYCCDLETYSLSPASGGNGSEPFPLLFPLHIVGVKDLSFHKTAVIFVLARVSIIPSSYHSM